jgi:hypothetical protein
MLNLPSFQPSEPRDLRNLPQVTATKFIIPKFKTTTDLVLHVDIVFSFVVCCMFRKELVRCPQAVFFV